MAKNTMLQKVFPHLGAFVLFLIVPIIYFLPQLQGKVIQSSDIVSARAMGKEITDYRETTGNRSWWTNSMFGGMPAYQIEAGQPSNMLKYVEKVSQLYISRPIGYFFALSLSIYALMIFMGVNPWLSIIGAFCFSFSTGNLILFEAGHMSKLRVIAFFGLIVMGLLMTFRKNYLSGGILFAAGVGLSLYGNHVQMVYYFFMVLAIYGIIEIVNKIKAGEVADLGKMIAVLVLATMIGVASSASKLWTTYEYSKDTMRGDPILSSASANGPSSSSETKGLEYGYAMQWSNGFLDLVSAMIPGVVGGGSQEEVSTSSAVYKDLQSKGARLGTNFKAPLYWGGLPGTSGPFYLGAVICFLFILGLTLLKGPVKWWFGLGVLLVFLLSLGKNFDPFNRLIFDYLPLYNKFRTPNSILTIASFFMPVLGVLVVSDIINGKIAKENFMRGLKISLGISGGICLFFATIGPSMFNMSGAGDARLAEAGYNLQALLADRQSLMRSDSFRSLVLIALSGGLLWAFVYDKIKSPILIAALGVLAVGDLWTVNKRYLDDADFVANTKYESRFNPRPVDQQILKDTDLSYRVLDLSIDTYQDASSSYFHKTIGGYHAAKLQRYEDLKNRYLVRGNQGVLGMLNTKYVITQDQQAQRFPNAMGNAWTVSQIQQVATPNEEIDALNDLNPAEKAIVHQEFADYIGGLSPQGTGTVELTKYLPDVLTYQSNATSEELAVFSEVWYGPDKGWNAYIDGELVDHIRVNYILRALKIPAGQHEIEFKFEPQTFYTGETITLIFSLLILLSFLGLIGYEFMESKKRWDLMPEETVKPKPKKTLTKTKAQKKKKKK